MRVVVGLLVFGLAGCESGTVALDPSLGGDAGPMNVRPGSIFDPAANLETTEPMTVFAPDLDGPQDVLQGADFQLTWTGSKYLLVWVQNRGRLVLLSRTVDPTSGAMSPIRTVLGPESGINTGIAGVWSGDRYAVLYATDARMMIVWTDADGQLTAGPVDVAPIELLRLARFGFVAAQGGYLAFTHRLLEGEAAVYKIDANGRLVAGYPRAIPGFVDAGYRFSSGRVVASGDSLGLVWITSTPSEGLLKYSDLSAGFELSGERLLLRRDSVFGAWLANNREPEVALFGDTEDGIHLLDLASGESGKVIDAKFSHWSAFHDPDGPRVAIVHSTGEYQPTNPLSTGVAFSSIDYRADVVRTPIPIAEGPGCLERSESVLVSSDRLGLAWVTGCSERWLWLAEVRAFD